jgi:hypothetical protein
VKAAQGGCKSIIKKFLKKSNNPPIDEDDVQFVTESPPSGNLTLYALENCNFLP